MLVKSRIVRALRIACTLSNNPQKNQKKIVKVCVVVSFFFSRLDRCIGCLKDGTSPENGVYYTVTMPRTQTHIHACTISSPSAHWSYDSAGRRQRQK